MLSIYLTKNRSIQTPIDRLCFSRSAMFFFAIFGASALSHLVPAQASAQVPLQLPAQLQTQARVGVGVELSRADVVARALAHSPALQLAEAQVRLASAHRVGASMFVRDNPTLSLWSGPRVLASGDVLADLTLGISWPFDLSGSRAARVETANAGVRLAESQAQWMQQVAVFDALELWLRAIAAQKRVELERVQVTLGETALRVAQVRRAQGAVGEQESLVAQLALSTARARVLAAEGEPRALIEQLRVLLGLGSGALSVSRELPTQSLAPLETLIAGLERRADVLQAVQRIDVARAEVQLQQRLAVPLPRVGLGGGRENEYFARVGLDIALPVFQRNQTAIAVATEQIAVNTVERDTVVRRAEGELRAAYARYEAAQRTLTELQSTLPIIAETERLATRGFELGQNDLTATLVAYREAAHARALHLEAMVTLATTQLAVERAAGLSHP